MVTGAVGLKGAVGLQGAVGPQGQRITRGSGPQWKQGNMGQRATGAAATWAVGLQGAVSHRGS